MYKPESMRVKSELKGFLLENPEFTEDLLYLIAEHADTYFLSKGFSLRMSALFKIMVNPQSNKIYCNEETRYAIEQDLGLLASKHGDDYDVFVYIIKKYAWEYRIGYCALAEMITDGHLFIQNGGKADVL